MRFARRGLGAVASSFFLSFASSSFAGPSALAQPASPPGADLRGPLDSDQDGLPDAVEARTGTSPLDADTDSDGVDDGVEDANQDGVVDPGERDPRVPGLHHTAAHLPEPMIFDLVRGLGARGGEIEVNTLAVLDLADEGGWVAWAPEIEWAIVDGFAVELELPMVDAHLHSVKLAVQGTLPSPDAAFAHGVQVFGEVATGSEPHQGVAVYMLGARFGPAVLFGMLGARVRGAVQDGEASPPDPVVTVELLVNPTVSVDLHETVTVALEGNVAVALDGAPSLRLVPQVHWQIVERLRVQIGVGASSIADRWAPLVATRLILE